MIWSKHAERRAAEMGLAPAEVAAVVQAPEATYPGNPEYGPGKRVHVRGRLAVVVDREGVIVTCLWRGRLGRHEVTT